LSAVSLVVVVVVVVREQKGKPLRLGGRKKAALIVNGYRKVLW
jgi:hypothetical protein